MKAIFIGGPLHGETKQVEPSHTRCCWHLPPRGFRNGNDPEIEAEVVTYHRMFTFGDAAVFVIPGEEYCKLLVEVLERGLQFSAEPPLRETVSMAYHLCRSYLALSSDADEKKNIEFLMNLIREKWKIRQEFRSRK